ncbi:MAG: flagellar assembly protein FliW [Treponema sp.]|jgi:flagellar assembly factor FliW|nr:flagellar assembly protein FliW [Treponema sp.]
MEILTKVYGPVEIDEKQKIVFPEGLYGFENIKDFALIAAEQTPFFYLQSITNKDVAFILIDPFLFCPEYEPDVDNDELAAIGIHDPQDALVFAIITIRPDSNMTANLQGPLIVNRKNRLGRQAILSDPRWEIQHEIEIVEESC